MSSELNHPKRSLDDLLGLDADPFLGPAGQDRLRERLAEARASGDELDVVLGLDRVDLPQGLAERVLKGVRDQSAAPSPDVLVPVATADAARRRWRPRLLLPIAAAAAAALTLWMTRGDTAGTGVTGPDPFTDSALVADAPEVEVSDELLASLSVLENMNFLTEELDPFEADALFLFEAEDQVLFDLLISEDYDLDGVESDSGPLGDESGDRR